MAFVIVTETHWTKSVSLLLKPLEPLFSSSITLRTTTFQKTAAGDLAVLGGGHELWVTPS